MANLIIPAAHSLFSSLLHLVCLHTLSGHTGSALVWHTRGRVFEPRLLQQVLRFVGRVNTMELRGYCA